MEDLRSYEKNIYSQSGEDGVIDRVFQLVAPAHKWCVELGALNGVHHSNTRHQIVEQGWSAVLIEPDDTYFEKLQETYADMPGIRCVNTFIDFSPEHSLDAVLATTPIPKDFDLLSLDIDGNDYHVWDSMREYTPRVVIVESNPSIPNDISFIQPRDMQVQQGSSGRALVELGERKGYTLCTVTGSNLIFIRNELFPQLGISARPLEELYDNSKCLTRLFQLYDGTLVLDGCKQLLWRGGMPIDEEKIQVLPKSRRKFIAGISSRPLERRATYWYRRSPLYSVAQKVRRALNL